MTLVFTAISGLVLAQVGPDAQVASTIRGTVKDPTGAVIAGAVVTLETLGLTQQRTAITDEGGEFNFSAAPERTYKLTIAASGFAPWMADNVKPTSGENPAELFAVLQVAPSSTEVNATLPPQELATEQVKAEEKQRVLGLFPNFLVTYDPNAAPLTTKQKFQLGWRTFFDPVPILFSGAGAGIQQARNSYPGFGQGVEGFAKRFGVNYADRVDSVLIGHVVMQSVFHQDPRYFYKGTGSFGSRAFYAISRAFVVEGDNGRWQLAYSEVVGGMASYEISTLYRPGTSRPVLRLEHTILLGFAGRATRNLVQEFLLPKLTTHLPKTTASLSQPLLHAGTPVPLISMEDLSAKTAGSMETIGFVLASDLQADGSIVAKAGSQAWGRVDYTAAPGANGLSNDLNRVRLSVGNTNVPLRSTQVRDGSPVVAYH